MAVTQGAVADALATFLITDTKADNTVEPNVTGNTSGLIYCVYGDNTKNGSVASFVKVADNSTAQSASTIPDFVFYYPGGKAVSYTFITGVEYAAGVSLWGTTTTASGSAQGVPSSDFLVRVLAT
jgi:hypothetical protein